MKLYLYINAIRFVAGVWSILALYDWGSHIWAVFGGRMLRARLRGAGIGAVGILSCHINIDRRISHLHQIAGQMINVPSGQLGGAVNIT